jgi:peptidoglycan/LPS O-acetylase OafA/YrhL
MKANKDAVIRALAVLLVLNSHLDPFYANKMLSGGGALANALFFFLSGVAANASSASAAGLGIWDSLKMAALRVPRIYAPAWVVGVLLTLFHIYQFEDAKDFFNAVIWPTRYWFLYALVLFYPVVLFAAHSLRRIGLVALTLLIVYGVWYTTALDLDRFSVEGYYFRWITYLGLMLFGATLEHWPRPSRVVSIFFAALSAMAFVAVKWGLPRLQIWDLQFLLSVLLFPFAYGAYWSLRDIVLPVIPSMAASFLARHSLEIYVIQMPLIYWIAAKEVSGPLGIALVATLTFALAPVLQRVCRFTHTSRSK